MTEPGYLLDWRLVVAPAREAELWLALTAIVPATLTVRLLLELCEHELGLPPDIARRRVAVHQLASYALVGLYLNFVNLFQLLLQFMGVRQSGE